MIPLLLFAATQAAVPASAPATADERYEACVALVASDAAAAVKSATEWSAAGGGGQARECLGLAHVALDHWAPATAAFEQAAKTAEIQGDDNAATLWVQAGNAALAGDDLAKARDDLSRAIKLPTLNDPLRGEAYLDRARAAVPAGDLPAARADIDAALKLVPRDPMAWLLSAALARRQGNSARAATDVAEADRLAPANDEVAAEQARIAAMAATQGAKP